MHTLLSIGALGVAVIVGGSGAAAQRPLPAAPGPSISGGWTRNADLSDAPPAERGQGGGDAGTRGNGGGNGGGGHRRGGGGFGGGGYGAGGGGGGQRGGGGGFGGGGYGRGGGGGRDAGGGRANPDEMIRMRDAMRDVTSP